MSNRRDWLKATLALTAGVPLTMTLADRLMAAPASEIEKEFFRRKGVKPANLRLGSNENPYGPSEAAKKAIIQILSEANRYPFQTASELREILAEKEGVSPEYVAVGAGSSDFLCATGAAFGLEGGSMLSAFPTFPTLMTYAEVFKARWDKVNVNDKLEYDYPAVAKQIKGDTRIIFVCNPNNPTGTVAPPEMVRSFCEDVCKKVPVFSDEAYLEFLEPKDQHSMVDLVKKDQNIIVSRTFSKIYGLAGLRLGYIIAKPDLLRKITRHQNGLSNNQIGVAAAQASLGDDAFMEMTRKKNAAARKVLTDYLDKQGYKYGKSYTNFVLFDPRADARRILDQLADRGIRIRVWDYDNKPWLRVSIGTLEEMESFVKVYDEINS